MGSEWKYSTVAECASEEPFSTQIGPFGNKIKAEIYTLTGAPVLRGTNVNSNNRFHDSDFVFIDQEYADSEFEKFTCKAGDVVLCHKGTLGKIGIIPNDSKFETYIMGNSMLKVRTNERKLSSLFLYYWLCSFEGQDYLFSRVSQVGVPQIQRPLSTLREAEIPLPPLPEQKAIAHILGSLDDKIELNRRMNATLEGMAQALFKSWFVDFDPVIDNALAAGNPIPAELAARAEVRRQALANGTANRDLSAVALAKEEAAKPFPAAFQRTESMGWIPKGWEVQSIAEAAEKIGMGPFGSRITRDNFMEVGVPVIRGGNLTKGFVDKNFVYLTEDKATELKSANVFPGDIIFTHRGTIGQVGIIPNNSQHPRYVVSQSQMFLRINKQVTSSAYAFNYFKSGSGMERLLGYASQVGVPAIARPTTSLKSLPILIPEQEAVEAFDLQNTSYVNKINACEEQTEALTKLRDTLLPKLISGELRIPEAQQLTEEALV